MDPSQKWCYCKKAAEAGVLEQDMLSAGAGAALFGWRRRDAGPGLCTSVVAQDAAGRVWHGRNLDWNLPWALRKMLIDVEYRRGNQTVFVGTTVPGFVGVYAPLPPS